MGLTYSDMQRNRSVAPWMGTPTLAHAICLYPTLGVVEGLYQPPAPFYMLECNNVGGAKYLTRPTPTDGVNPNISTFWECWFQLSGAAQQFYFVICNQTNPQATSATVRGYAIFVNGVGGAISIVRLDGTGVVVVVNTVAWVADTNLHRVRFSREVSGANRFWRLYVDTPLTAAAGPTNDATYTNFSWWGWNLMDNARGAVGGESCQS